MLAKRGLWALPLVIAVGAALSALGGYALEAGGHESILAERLQYYSNFTRYALGTESYHVYRGQLDDHVSRTLLVAGAIRRTPPGTLLVWGNAPWIYALSQRLRPRRIPPRFELPRYQERSPRYDVRFAMDDRWKW
jgi:hypothetical protein